MLACPAVTPEQPGETPLEGGASESPAPLPAVRYELKARSVSEILDGTFKLYRDNFAPLLAISLIGAIPLLFFDALAVQANQAVKAASMGAAMGAVGGLLLLLPFMLLAITVQYCALSCAAADAYLGRRFTVGGALGRAFRRLGSLVWAGLLVTGGLLLGFIAFIVPAFYLMLIWARWLQALVVEDKRGSAALGRSYALTKGSVGKLGGLLFVFAIVQYAIIYGVKAAVPAGLEAVPLLGVALEQLPSVLLAPLYPALFTLFYFDGRIRHEGFDLEMKAAETLPAA